MRPCSSCQGARDDLGRSLQLGGRKVAEAACFGYGAEELGLAPAQEVKLRKIQEGTTALAAIGLGTVGMVGIGALIDGGDTCMDTDVAGTASQTVVQKSASGVFDSVAIPEMDSAVSASQLHPTTHSKDTITHPLPSLPPSSASSLSQLSPSTDTSTEPWPAFSPNSTPLAPNFTDLAQFSVSACNCDKKNCRVFVAKNRVTSR